MPNMTAPEITDVDELRSRYREPTPAVLHKARPVIDPAAADFIAASPFMVVATTSAGGTDASPRGGPPGFVVTLDEGTIAFGDLAGNNRLDSYANIVEHPAVGLLFLVPGLEETLRVNGQARVTTDPEVLDRTTVEGRRRPKWPSSSTSTSATSTAARRSAAAACGTRPPGRPTTSAPPPAR